MITTAPENPRKDPTDALAGAATVTGDLEISLVLAGTAVGTGDPVHFLGSITTAPENPREDPTDTLTGTVAVTGDPKATVMLAGTAAGTGDPVNFLGLPLELSPTAHEA